MKDRKKTQELIVYDNPKSPISEIFRTLRTNIQFMDTNKSSKTILITSTYAGEGKSWVSSNLAISFAQTGKKVLLIDADMRKGRQYKIFGLSPIPGLSNYLSGIDTDGFEEKYEDIEEYVNKTEIDNLFVMVAGSTPPNPSELLNSAQMVHLLSDSKKLFDIIIIDSTPSLLVTDSLIVSRLVSSTIVVTACKETKREELDRVISNIQNIGGKIAGVVLNKVPISPKKYEKRYYYSTHANTRNQPKHDKTIERKNSITEEEYKLIDNQNLQTTDEILKQINDYIEKRN